MDRENRDTINDQKNYEEFYDLLGKFYPETELVHVNRSMASRYGTITSILKPFAKKHLKLLDIGCNDGVYTIPYVKQGGNAVGVDISENLIQKAKNNSKDLNVKFLKADIQKPDFLTNERFDIVLFSEVFEHLIDRDRAIQNISSILRENGFLLLTTPTPTFEIMSRLNPKGLFNTLFSNKFVEEQIIDSNLNRLSDYGLNGFVYRHDSFYPRGLANYLKSHGFKILNQYTIRFRYIGKRGIKFKKIPILKNLGDTNIILVQKK